MKYNLFFNPRKLYSTTTSERRKLWVDFSIFNFEDFDSFKNELFYSGKLIPGVSYSILIKLKKGDIYYMIADKQKSFSFNQIDDDSFRELFTFSIDRLCKIFDEYESELDYSCDSVLFDFWPVVIKDNIKISNLDQAKNELSLSSFKVAKAGFNFFGNSLDVKGAPLNVKLLDNSLYIKGLEFFGLEDFSNRFLSNFKSGNSDYLFNIKSKFYLVNIRSKNYIIICDQIDENTVFKRCFNKFGQLVDQVRDIVISDECFKRISGNFVTIFNNINQIIYSERKISFDSIKSDFKVSNDKGLPNSNIGTIDLETYEDNGESKCFAIGFYSNMNEKPITFYINNEFDSTNLIHKCFDELLRPKYKDTIFYIHNLGGFDAPFIIKALTLFNKTPEGEQSPYMLESINRDANVLKLIVKRKIEGKVRIVKIQDSASMLPGKLIDLCKDYDVEIHKGYFPYDFCNKNTLFYKGHTPDISYYKDMDKKLYKKLYKEVWDLKQECLEYLEKDLLSLYQVLEKVNKTIHFLFNIQMTDSLTISGLAMRIFLTHHYDLQRNDGIPLIIKKGVFDDIHKSYYGGRVEVYNPTTFSRKRLYYYDVNSLFPFASLNSMPSTDCVYIECLKEYPEIDDLFGFFYCKIKASDNYLGLLPVRTPRGLIFPVGEWEGWYFSEELKFGKNNGFDIKVVKGYKFNKVENVFNSFVDEISKIKLNPKNPTEKNIAKLILNSLIGRFGMNFLKTVTKLVNREGHNLISTTRVQKNFIEIDDDTFLEYYKPNIDKEVCDVFGVDFTKALNNEKFEEVKSNRTYRSVSISTASAILAYARIHMAKIKLYILSIGGNIFYTDTDSLITDVKLPAHLVHPKEIGKFKLEHVIKKGYFIGDKIYAFKTTNNEVIKRARSVKSSELTFNDYIKMYNMKVIKNATKTNVIRDYKKGSVLIKTNKNVILNTNDYFKRQRVFDNKGKWIGTKPLNIEYINNEINIKNR